MRIDNIEIRRIFRHVISDNSKGPVSVALLPDIVLQSDIGVASQRVALRNSMKLIAVSRSISICSGFRFIRR